jgi:autophagy-related protein 9
MRRFSLLAKWKLRELNELPHLLEQRLNKAYLPSNEYLAQFPSESANIVARLVSFILGSVTGVLVSLSLFLPDTLLYLEITKERTLIFYLGLLASILAITRSFRSPEVLVYDPENSMREVILHTHFCPSSWQNRLHSLNVKNEFAALFSYRVMQYVKEFLSVICSPLVLGFSLPSRSQAIVDFLLDQSVYVPGLGFVYADSLFIQDGDDLLDLITAEDAEPVQPISSIEPKQTSLLSGPKSKMAKSILYFKVVL